MEAVCINNYISPVSGKISAPKVLITFYIKQLKTPILEESSCDLSTKPSLVGLKQLQNMLVDGMSSLETQPGTWGMGSSRAAQAAVTMKFWSLRSLGHQGGCPLDFRTKEGLSTRIECRGKEPWWEEGELEDTQGLPPPISRTMHLYKEEVREYCQEVSIDFNKELLDKHAQVAQ